MALCDGGGGVLFSKAVAHTLNACSSLCCVVVVIVVYIM